MYISPPPPLYPRNLGVEMPTKRVDLSSVQISRKFLPFILPQINSGPQSKIPLKTLLNFNHRFGDEVIYWDIWMFLSFLTISYSFHCCGIKMFFFSFPIESMEHQTYSDCTILYTGYYNLRAGIVVKQVFIELKEQTGNKILILHKVEHGRAQATPGWWDK